MNILAIAQKIEDLCVSKGVKVKHMLIECGVNKNTVDNMKNGSEPSVGKIAKIADYFDCSVDYLLGRTDIPEVNRGAGQHRFPSLEEAMRMMEEQDNREYRSDRLDDDGTEHIAAFGLGIWENDPPDKK